MRVLIVLVSTFDDDDDDLGLIPAINGGQLGEMISLAASVYLRSRVKVSK